MGKLGKETKNLLLAITVICLISFLLAAGLSFLLAKDFQHEMLLHDYGVSGYQLNHEDKLQISAFTAHPNESDIERGKEALASIGYSEATSMQLLPTVREYRNQTMLYLFLLLLFLFGMVYLVLLFYLRRQHRAIDDAGSKIREFLDGNSMSRIECSQTGDWYSLFHDVNEMATILSAHAESQKQTKEFLQDIISDVSHQIKTPLSALKMYHEIISSHKGEAETVANFSEKSQREIKRMENVIYTLLKLARLDAGIIQMEKAEENVSALMQDVLEALFGEGVTFTDALIQAQQQRGLYYAFATLVYGFLSIIVAITIFHIMNTISMGVSARTRQYGVMRAIGMSNQQLTRMISAEAASYAISGVILGCIFGLLFHWFLYSSLITRTFGNPWSVPWLELCLIIGVILATTALAVRGPARRLHAMSIVENISSQ